MGIPSKQIGWGTESNLLWQIAKQLEQASCQLCTLNDNIQTITGTSGTSGTSGAQGPAGDLSGLYYGSFIFDHSTTLLADMNSNTTAPIQVVSTTGFAAPGYLVISAEVIAYTGTTPTTFTGITRGVAGSNGANHTAGDGIAQAQVVAAGVPTQVKIDETDLSNGVTLSGSGDITVANAGVYNVQFSAQIENFGNDFSDTSIWFRINGVDIPKSASYVTTSAIHGGSPGATIMTVNIFYACVANDVISLAWTTLSGTTVISSVAPVGSSIPQSPGIILTVNKIGI